MGHFRATICDGCSQCPTMYLYISGGEAYHYESIGGADESSNACTAANIMGPSFCPSFHYSTAIPDVPYGDFSLITDVCMGVENLVSIYYLLH